MSAANVQLARRGFEAVARGDFDALRELLDPDIQWHGSDGPGEQSCHSRDEALHFIRAAVERGALGQLADVIDAGDQVIVVMRPPGTVEPGGTELRANLTTFRHGKVVQMVAYETAEAALAATRT
ncbi:MAG: nuclear transport factor 2 family protein [Solirubrobacteraceae bacterium]